MTQKPLKERLLDRLRTLGLPERKAKELAKGLASTASRTPVTGTVTGKLTARLIKLGLSERKATELAKGLAPTVRASIKAKAKKAKKKLDEVDDAFVNEIVDEGVDLSENEELDKVAPRVNGHRVRLDLPVVARSFWQRSPVKGIELLRVVDGLTTSRTYLVAAVKKDIGFVAVRQFDPAYYNVKFYPNMAFWDQTPEALARIGAEDHLQREWYERMHFSRESLDTLLKQLVKEAKPKSKIRALMKRFLSVGSVPLVKAFDYLHQRVAKVA